MWKEKLLISSCLIGENVKYDGLNNCLDENILDKLKEKYHLINFCPEVEGGLPTPRIPCEIISLKPLKIINKIDEDKTINFINGANKTLQLCKKENIKIALLKANSPSCSNKFIYNGKFNSTKVNGFGVTAKLLIENNIKVIDENEIEKLLYIS
ncbi:MAG: DUF523 domain-containing protein [Campylobacterota bacterium]|nr:DUF523 domain-containing protein [Campylobacterota bacterium]